MIACTDVAYGPSWAVAACLAFSDWRAASPEIEVVRQVPDIAPYESGQLYLRELPSLLAVLRALPDHPTTVLVDGYVWINDDRGLGLGAHLYHALGEATPVVGVAKRRHWSAPARAILRGSGNSPLFVSAAGMDVALAASLILSMHGPFRIPTLLKRVDRLSRSHMPTLISQEEGSVARR